MKIRLKADQLEKLRQPLRKARSREIGGQIFGEQLGPLEFRVAEFTVQARRGTVTRFVVDLFQAAKDAFRFFEQTGHRYRQFNYLGEWHSHPSFEVKPSGFDIATMRDIVFDPEYRGSFVILMIAKLVESEVRIGGWLFDPQGHEASVELLIED